MMSSFNKTSIDEEIYVDGKSKLPQFLEVIDISFWGIRD